jgi:hypothetical protein
MGSEAKKKGYALQMPPRGKALYKVPLPEQGQKITPRDTAAEEPAAG